MEEKDVACYDLINSSKYLSSKQLLTLQILSGFLLLYVLLIPILGAILLCKKVLDIEMSRKKMLLTSMQVTAIAKVILMASYYKPYYAVNQDGEVFRVCPDFFQYES